MAGTQACRRIMALAVLLVAGLLLPAARRLALADGNRFELSAVYRSLGYRDLREPSSFTPSAAFVAQYGGWTRNWSERRAYASLSWRLVETDHAVVAAGGHLGTSNGFFEAKNIGIGYYEAWETRPALLWGPSARLVLRQGPRQGAFLRLDYAFFAASAPETRETVSSRTGTATPGTSRDAVFSWTSHEAMAALGYDWGPVAAAAGLSLTAFRLDKRLSHHIDPTGAAGNALAAILALNAFESRYGYEPQTLFAPCLSLTFRPTRRLALEGLLRPAGQPDATVALSVSF